MLRAEAERIYKLEQYGEQMFQTDPEAVESVKMQEAVAGRLKLSDKSHEIIRYLSDRQYPLPALDDASLAAEYDRVLLFEKYATTIMFDLTPDSGSWMPSLSLGTVDAKSKEFTVMMTCIVFFACFFFVKKFQGIIETAMESKPYRNLTDKASNSISSSNNSQDPAAKKQSSAEN